MYFFFNIRPKPNTKYRPKHHRHIQSYIEFWSQASYTHTRTHTRNACTHACARTRTHTRTRNACTHAHTHFEQRKEHRYRKYNHKKHQPIEGRAKSTSLHSPDLGVESSTSTSGWSFALTRTLQLCMWIDIWNKISIGLLMILHSIVKSLLRMFQSVQHWDTNMN
jgi:hypothetical protein